MSKSPSPASPAPTCLACQRQLSPSEALLAACPYCGAPRTAKGQPPQGPDEGKATVSEIGRTIEVSDLEFDAPAGVEPVPGKGTIDESQQHQTLDEHSLPPSASSK